MTGLDALEAELRRSRAQWLEKAGDRKDMANWTTSEAYAAGLAAAYSRSAGLVAAERDRQRAIVEQQPFAETDA